jgi:LytS/YehU family sensor histidine kinase
MKIKFLSFLALSTCLVLLPGCVGTQDGHSVAGWPLNKDRFTSRYERPAAQLVAATRTVLNRNGKILVDNAVNNTFEAKINQHRVWVKVADIDGKITEVTVQARGRMAGDADTASEISKQIAMQLVAGPSQN